MVEYIMISYLFMIFFVTLTNLLSYNKYTFTSVHWYLSIFAPITLPAFIVSLIITFFMYIIDKTKILFNKQNK